MPRVVRAQCRIVMPRAHVCSYVIGALVAAAANEDGPIPWFAVEREDSLLR